MNILLLVYNTKKEPTLLFSIFVLFACSDATFEDVPLSSMDSIGADKDML